MDSVNAKRGLQRMKQPLHTLHHFRLRCLAILSLDTLREVRPDRRVHNEKLVTVTKLTVASDSRVAGTPSIPSIPFCPSPPARPGSPSPPIAVSRTSLPAGISTKVGGSCLDSNLMTCTRIPCRESRDSEISIAKKPAGAPGIAGTALVPGRPSLF